MDFSKAKSVLIGLFLCLNFFLGYQLVQMHQWVTFPEGFLGEGANPEDEERLEEMLEEYNYQLQGDFPRGTLEKSFLQVRPPAWEEEELLARFFGEDKEKVEKESREDTMVYRHQGGELIIYHHGAYRYSPPQDDEEGEAEMDAGQARELAEDFIETHQLKPEDTIHSLTLQEEDGFYLVYHQEWLDLPVYASYLMVTVEGERVAQVESYWPEVKGLEEEREMEIIPGAAALVRFMEDRGVSHQGEVVEDVELGYYSIEYDAEKWEVPPVWRIVLEGGEVYYLNAFTGNLEYPPEEQQSRKHKRWGVTCQS